MSIISQQCVQMDDLQSGITTMISANPTKNDAQTIELASKDLGKNETLSQRKSVSKLSKTKKKKSQINKLDKDSLWNIFDNDMKSIKEADGP